MTRPGPLKTELYRILADGEWHLYEQVLVRLMNSGNILPGPAYRTREERRLRNYARREREIKPPRLNLSKEEQVRIGARHIAVNACRSPYLERKVEETEFGPRKMVRLAKPLPSSWGIERPSPKSGRHNGRFIERGPAIREIVAIVEANPGIGKKALAEKITSLGGYNTRLKTIERAAQEGWIREEVSPRHPRWRVYYPIEDE